MAYLAPKIHDHGVIDLGCNSYGGLAFTDNFIRTLHDSDSDSETSTSFVDEEPKFKSNFRRKPSEKTKQIFNSHHFISEHNLANYWRRPGLFPRSAGFPIPVIDTIMDYNQGVRNRLPGHIRSDCATIRYRQRNLLAGEMNKETENCIRLWAINDTSDHKTLLEYELLLANESEDIDNINRIHHIRNLHEGPSQKIPLPNEVLQLKTFECVEGGKVLVRSKRLLNLINMNEVDQPKLNSIFNSPIQNFIQIPYMPDEMAIVDSNGFIFWGTIGTTFSRSKTSHNFKAICPTDCPRILIGLADKHLIEFDLRIANDAGQVIFSHSPVNPSTWVLPESSYEFLGARESFFHVNSLDTQLNTLILTSSRRHFLLDRRMLKREILHIGHAEMDGADYCITTPAFKDPISGGSIYSMYSLTQIRRPALSHWSVIYHPNEGFWSSIGPKYELDTPKENITDFLNSHIAINQMNAKILEKIPSITRAIHYQQIPTSLNIQKSILFRQMEGGEIWYENIFLDPLTEIYSGNDEISQVEKNLDETQFEDNFSQYFEKDNKKNFNDGNFGMDQFLLKKHALKLIHRFYRQKQNSKKQLNYVSGVNSDYLQTPSNFIQVIETNLGTILEKINIPDVNERPLNSDPFLGIGFTNSEELEMEKLENFVEIGEISDNDDRLLTRITLKMWEKVLKYHENRDDETNLQEPENEQMQETKKNLKNESDSDFLDDENFKDDFGMDVN